MYLKAQDIKMDFKQVHENVNTVAWHIARTVGLSVFIELKLLFVC